MFKGVVVERLLVKGEEVTEAIDAILDEAMVQPAPVLPSLLRACFEEQERLLHTLDRLGVGCGFLGMLANRIAAALHRLETAAEGDSGAFILACQALLGALVQSADILTPCDEVGTGTARQNILLPFAGLLRWGAATDMNIRSLRPMFAGMLSSLTDLMHDTLMKDGRRTAEDIARELGHGDPECERLQTADLLVEYSGPAADATAGRTRRWSRYMKVPVLGELFRLRKRLVQSGFPEDEAMGMCSWTMLHDLRRDCGIYMADMRLCVRMLTTYAAPFVVSAADARAFVFAMAGVMAMEYSTPDAEMSRG